MSSHLCSTTCYEAVTRDDPEFDGVFFSAVLTTGIYCRPICRAQTPRPENIRFFATAVAAAEAGFRPCLQCRPELAPDPPSNPGLSPLVARGLQLISRGVLDDSGVDELARRLGVSPRQMRRIFLDEIGAPPVAVAQTRRLLFAKKLIDETNLSMTDIAFSAGYGSVRRFNDAIRQTYRRTPSEIRKLRRASAKGSDETIVELKLHYRDPYNWPAMFAMLRAQAIPRVEFVGADVYRRAMRVHDTAGRVEVVPLPAERAVSVRISPALTRYLLPITEIVKGIFDLRADPLEIATQLSSDPELAPLLRAHAGVRLPGVWDGFELAVCAILDTHPVLQGNHLAAALVDVCGERWDASADPTLSHLFPRPEQLMRSELSSIGLSDVQIAALRRVAVAVDHGYLAFDGELPADTLLARLIDVAGLEFDAVYRVVMRSLAEPDMPPLDPDANARQPHRRSDSWRPWRSYAALYLRVAALAPASIAAPAAG